MNVVIALARAIAFFLALSWALGLLWFLEDQLADTVITAISIVVALLIAATTRDRLLVLRSVRLVYAAIIALGMFAGAYLALARFSAEGLNGVAVASIAVLALLLSRTISRVRAS